MSYNDRTYNFKNYSLYHYCNNIKSLLYFRQRSLFCLFVFLFQTCIQTEIKHVDLNETMVRALAKQAEAERERRAKVIHAQGEAEAAQKLAEAASVLAGQDQAIQLRYLQTLVEIAGDKSSTIVFPLPIDLIESFKKKV